jgi:ribonuclease BN (tRNA processing enzyme)
VTALGIPHGIVPAVAYRVDAADRSIVFGADQNGGSVLFSEFARNADVLVAHMAIPEDSGRVARNLHATPSAIGKMATDAEVSQLLLSHFMARSLKALDTNIELVREHFTGDVIQADDMTCLVP